MFANLLAADMDADKKVNVHPAFVELIKEMTSGEAKLLRCMKESGPQTIFELRAAIGKQWGTYRTLSRSYSIEIPGIVGANLSVGISNLERLGLLTVNDGIWPAQDTFDEMATQIYAKAKAQYAELGEEEAPVEVVRFGIYVTALGERFTEICLTSAEKENPPPSNAAG